MWNMLKREWLALRALLRVQKVLGLLDPDGEYLLPDLIEATIAENPSQPAIRFEGAIWSYAEFDAYACRVAHWAKAQGLKQGDCVALFMLNRPEYLAIWFGLSKIGVVTALLNNQLTGHALAHCVNVAGARHLIIDHEITQLADGAAAHFENTPERWVQGGEAASFDAALNAQPATPIARSARAGLKAGDEALKIYTSGTTGLPKAARITHARAMYYLLVFSRGNNATSDDVMFMTLPLYHSTGGLCGVGFALTTGGMLALEKSFSRSVFWNRVRESGATYVMYVGELCRFLLNAPEEPGERDHRVKAFVGNGLRPDVWQRFVDRFAIPRIMEFYGSTEGNVGLANFDGKVGAIGRIPPYLKRRFNVRLVAFDNDSEMPLRLANGRCRESRDGEIGEAIGRISGDDPRFRYDGYANAPEATRKKVLTDVFEDGDRWFRTGDLMTRDAAGYYYFVDRIGDTFRWKSENVSTSEVASVLGHHPDVRQANVYGVPVPGYDGKAGMAAVLLSGSADMSALSAYVEAELPYFARPQFLRVINEEGADLTGTFKLKKTDLVEDGFDPDRISDRLYVWDDERGYLPLDGAVFRSISDGARRL